MLVGYYALLTSACCLLPFARRVKHNDCALAYKSWKNEMDMRAEVWSGVSRQESLKIRSRVSRQESLTGVLRPNITASSILLG